MWILKTKSRSFSKATSALNSVSHLSSPILTLFKFKFSSPCVGPGRVNSKPLKGNIVMINPVRTTGWRAQSLRVGASKAIHSAIQYLHYHLKNHRSLILSRALPGASDRTSSGMCVATWAVLPSSDVGWGWHIAGALPYPRWHWLLVQKDSRIALRSHNSVSQSLRLKAILCAPPWWAVLLLKLCVIKSNLSARRETPPQQQRPLSLFLGADCN